MVKDQSIQYTNNNGNIECLYCGSNKHIIKDVNYVILMYINITNAHSLIKINLYTIKQKNNIIYNENDINNRIHKLVPLSSKINGHGWKKKK